MASTDQRSLWTQVDINQLASTVASVQATVLGGSMPALTPSGDTTGVTDDTNISALLGAYGGIRLGRGTFYTKLGLAAAGGVSGQGGLIEGVGANATLVKLANGANVDVASLTGAFWRLSNLCIDGNKANNASGNGVVCTMPRTQVDHVIIQNCAGHGLRNFGLVSQTAHANEFHHIRVLTCGGDGIHVDGIYATDGRFSNIEVGQCGGYGLYWESSALLLNQCHSWGNTLDGFHGAGASYSMLSNCESETNSGHGVIFSFGIGNQIGGASYVWENQLRGIYYTNSNRGIVNGCLARNNKGGPGIAMDDCLYGAIVGNHCYDDFGTHLQTYGISTAGGTATSDHITVVGNVTRAADHLTGSMNLVGANNEVGHNHE